MKNDNLLTKSWNFIRTHRWPLFLIWSLWLTLEYFGLGPYSYIRIHDCANSVFPRDLGYFSEFFQYGFSNWSAQIAGGIDRLSNGGPLFHLDSLFFLTLPGWLTYAAITLIQRFIAGYFTYRLCRDYLRLGEFPSIVAGLAYSVSFFWFKSEFIGQAGFPLILWSLEYIH